MASGLPFLSIFNAAFKSALIKLPLLLLYKPLFTLLPLNSDFTNKSLSIYEDTDV